MPLGGQVLWGYSKLDSEESLPDLELCGREPRSERDPDISADVKRTRKGADSSDISSIGISWDFGWKLWSRVT